MPDAPAVLRPILIPQLESLKLRQVHDMAIGIVDSLKPTDQKQKNGSIRIAGPLSNVLDIPDISASVVHNGATASTPDNTIEMRRTPQPPVFTGPTRVRPARVMFRDGGSHDLVYKAVVRRNGQPLMFAGLLA